MPKITHDPPALPIPDYRVRIVCRDCDAERWLMSGAEISSLGWFGILKENPISKVRLRTWIDPDGFDAWNTDGPWWTHTGLCPECEAMEAAERAKYAESVTQGELFA